MFEIKSIPFNDSAPDKIKGIKGIDDWPVVYIINNKKEAYIGETTNVYNRTIQHLANPKRRTLKTINIITDGILNKSSILDYESFLIKHMGSDKLFVLQNGNGGLQNHDYYQRDLYDLKYDELWRLLKDNKLAVNDIVDIKNSDLFKYSPYKSLTNDQLLIVNSILTFLTESKAKNEHATILVKGGAGTGKTILGIYLVKLLVQMHEQFSNDLPDALADYDLSQIVELTNTLKDMRIGLVIPMENLRSTIKKVFKEVKGLDSKMVLSPNDVGKSMENYDLLIVDEAHRLRRRKNITNYEAFDRNNTQLGLSKEGTELDWIMMKSTYQVFFYDEAQSIKPTDIRKDKFEELKTVQNYREFELTTQQRCLKGGEEYVNYIKTIFSNNPPKNRIDFSEYDLKMFTSVKDMTDDIIAKDAQYQLCRNIAGFAWKWNSKGKVLPLHSSSKNLESGVYDIEIDGNKYIWNSQPTDWINSPNSLYEIGSIHTTQGFDLNYTGLIIGDELQYDTVQKKFKANRKVYYDVKGKASTDDDELLQYLLNIYTTMMLRGMLGTYVYVCDPGLRQYLAQYIDTK